MYRDINGAVEEYFSRGYGQKAPQKQKVNAKAIQQIFMRYIDKESKNMEAEGIQKFFMDLGIDPMDVLTLLISQYMQAETMGVYQYGEFEMLFKSLGIQSMEELKMKLPSLRQELESFKKFKELYKFVFDFSRDPGYKNLNVETAVGLWQLLLDSKCSFLNIWVDFITKEKKDLQVITKDIWNMLYELNE